MSSAPGRTRVVNFFRVTSVPKPGGGGRGDLYLVDLPGYGYARAPRDVRAQFETIAVSYLGRRGPLRLCVFIVDARHEPTGRDEALRDWLEHQGLPYVIAVNKIDALGRGKAAHAVQQVARGLGRGAEAVLGVSAEKGDGLDGLWNVIRGAAFAPAGGTDERATIDDGDANPPRTAGDHGR